MSASVQSEAEVYHALTYLDGNWTGITAAGIARLTGLPRDTVVTALRSLVAIGKARCQILDDTHYYNRVTIEIGDKQ